MVFPQDPLPIRSEILVDAVWTDYTSRIRGVTPGDINIKRGYSSEQSSLSTSVCTFTLNNADGLFSLRNPNSPLYGLVGRNTQTRHGVEVAQNSLRLTDTGTFGSGIYDGARAATTDKAVLDIVGDIDIRVDVEPDEWRGVPHAILAAKYTTFGDQRSWLLASRDDGLLELIWSTTGTAATRVFAQSTTPVPLIGRAALRVTLDVNNGAGGWTATFYQADTINGSWTSLGGESGTGVTSIFSSSSSLEVGTAEDGDDRLSVIGGYAPFVGRVYGFELRNGIAGTLVANMDATSRPEGNANWSDGLGTPNTWTLYASAEISGVDWRFWGDLAAPSMQWDGTGTDVHSLFKAADVFQRLGQSGSLGSAIFRNLVQHDWDGYWPCQDGFSAGFIGATVGHPASIYEVEFGGASDFPGSSGAMVFTDDTGDAEGVCEIASSGTGVIFLLLYFKFDTLPATTKTFFSFNLIGGTLKRVSLGLDATTFSLTGFDADGGLSNGVHNVAHGTGATPNQWMAMRLLLTQVGGTTEVEWGWYPKGAPVLYGTPHAFPGRTCGKPQGWTSPGYTGKFGLEICHIGMSRFDLDWAGSTFVNSTNAYLNERVRDRWFRLTGEESLPAWFIGRWSGTGLSPRMGPQVPNTLKSLLEECAAADGGMIYSPRDKYGVVLRSLSNMINQEGPEFDYSAKHFGDGTSSRLVPDEDFPIANDVTVSQPGGSYGVRRVRTTGPLNTSDPNVDPQGVGLYQVPYTRSLADAAALRDAAEWTLALGTWDEARWTTVPFELARGVFTADADLTAAVRWLDIGRPFTITGLPDFLPPEDAYVYVRGYGEVLRNRGQNLTFNTAPYELYRSGVWDSTVRVVDSGSTLLAEFIDATETSWDLTTTSEGDVWSTTAEPYYWFLRGEVIRVDSMGAVTGTGPYLQTATVTRSINGVEQTHQMGDEVHIYKPARYAPGGSGGDVVAAGDAVYAADLNQLLEKPMVRLIQQSAQSIADATNVAITFGTSSEDYDTHNFHNPSSNTSRITPTVAGYYTFKGMAFMSASNTYTAIASTIAKNGTSLPGFSRSDATTAVNSSRSQYVEMTLTADGSSDYFELIVSQTSGGAKNTNVSSPLASVFECVFERPL